jgi:glycosyltransferase 2 family protein
LPRALRLIVGLALAGAAIAWMSTAVDVEALRAVLQPLPWLHVVAAVAVMLGDFALRVTRWWLLIRAIRADVAWSACAVAHLTSTAINNLAPLRMGDAFRITSFPRLKLGPARLAGTLVVERVLDLWSLIGITTLVLTLLLPDMIPTVVLLAGWLGWVGLGVLVVVFRGLGHERFERLLLGRTGWPARIGRVLIDVLGAMRRGVGIRTLGPVMLLSATAWIFEGAAFAIVLAGTIPVASPALGWASMGGATLATMLPAAPGFIGTFHAAAMQPIMWSGFAATTAAAYVILVHVVVWVPITVVGVVVGAVAFLVNDIDAGYAARGGRGDAPARTPHDGGVPM